MSDPFLRSSGGDVPEPVGEMPDASPERFGLPREIAERLPWEAVEQFVSQVERWRDVQTGVDRTLISAGFHRHDPREDDGGFHIATGLRGDGVLVSWVLAGRMDIPADAYEDSVVAIMNPALLAILRASAFEAEIIPAGQDDAGCVLVTGAALSA